MCTYRLCCFYYFFIRCSLISVPYVIHNSSRKYKTVLHHHTHLCSERMYFYLWYVNSINKNFSAVNIVKTAQKIYDCCLSCSRWSDYRYRLSLFHIKTYIFKNRYSILIAKFYIFKWYITFYRRHIRCVRCILNFHRLIYCLKYSFKIWDCS